MLKVILKFGTLSRWPDQQFLSEKKVFKSRTRGRFAIASTIASGGMGGGDFSGKKATAPSPFRYIFFTFFFTAEKRARRDRRGERSDAHTCSLLIIIPHLLGTLQTSQKRWANWHLRSTGSHCDRAVVSLKISNPSASFQGSEKARNLCTPSHSWRIKMAAVV